jgi:hypothetical protein
VSVKNVHNSVTTRCDVKLQHVEALYSCNNDDDDDGDDDDDKHDMLCTYNLTCRSVRVTIISVEKLYVLNILSVCLQP